MKGRINFELEADNIVHAPVDTPKHFIKPINNRWVWGRCLMKQKGTTGNLIR